jgi:DNA-binding XRE family transcriptional regulator
VRKTDQDTLYRNLGYKIRVARERMGINQSLFATMLDLSRSSIVNIEVGRQRTSLHLLYEISKITDTSLSELLTDLVPDKETDNIMEIKEKISYKVSDFESVNKIADLIFGELD